MSVILERQVEEVNRSFYEAFEALDLEALLAVWDHGDSVACLHPGSDWQRGWAEVSAGWEAIIAHTSYVEFELGEVRIEVADPVAWVTCVERLTTAGRRESTAHVAEIAATNVFMLTRTGWRLVLHHASPVVRSAPTGE